MRLTLVPLTLAVALGAALPSAAARQTPAPPAPTAAAKKADLALDDLFPRKGFFGKRPRSLAWSGDDRYLAYAWNEWGVKGWDLWVYDTKEHKSRRLTSIEGFSAFDRELKPIIERYKKDKEEDDRRKTLSVEERRKLDDEDEKKERDRKEPLKEYSGVGDFAWAHNSPELLLTYKGDIFRMRVDDPAPKRLTDTQEAESAVRFTRDDRGFFFRRGPGLFLAHFDSAELEQVNPPLTGGASLGGYWISPDETKVLVAVDRSTGPEREVTYITYKDRFARANTTARAVADDTFKGETTLLVHRIHDDLKDEKSDGKPWEVYKWPAGEEMGQLSVHEEPWSADSRRVTYATWKRDKRELEIVVADTVDRKVASAYKTTHNGEHTTPGMARPFFTPDGSRIVALLEQSGFRHVWMVDPLTIGATQLTRGDFEVYPQNCTPDGKWLLATSNARVTARNDLYRVSLADGRMERITERDGSFSAVEPAHRGERVAANFISWKDPGELHCLEAKEKGRDDAVTAGSHAGTLADVVRLQPELFQYKNRLGQTVNGFLFKPKGWKKEAKHPLLIYVYGGPLGTGKQVLDGAYGSDGYLFAMYLAWTKGYLTATIDPRGTSGYGAAFGNANWEAPGKAQTEDLVDGVKWLDENYGVDRTRVGISGWSFGGFQTQMCMYTAPETFTLGIAGAGPTEWQNYNNWYAGGVIGKARPGKPEDLDKYSLTHVAANLKSPLMLLHGMEDTNVLFQDTVKVYRELLKAGKGPLVELVLDPTGGHGLGGDIKNKDRFRIYDAFLDRRWGSAAK